MMTPAHLVLVLLLLVAAQSAVLANQPAQEELKQLSLEELMRIDVTTASRRAEPIGLVDAAMSVITAEDIRRSGASTIAEALRLADGVHVARSNNGTWAITARGFNQSTANKLLVMIDGRTVYSPLFAGVFWNTIDHVLEDIERIEVIRGPGATLWGANAVNGVVNIITRHTRETQGALVSLAAGNEDRVTANFRYGAAAGGLTWRAYAKFAERDDQTLASGAGSADERTRGQAGFRLDGGNAAATSWFLTGDAFHSSDSFPGRPAGEFTELSLQSRWSFALARADRLDLRAYYRREYRHVPGQLTHYINVFDGEAQHETAVGTRHSVVWGGGARVNRDNTNGQTITFEPAARTYPVFNVFAQDTIALVPGRLFTTVGVKWEHNAFSGGHTQPSVRARLMLPRTQVLWGAVSHAVRRPTRLDDDVVIPSLGGPLVIGTGDFAPESLVAAEIGYRIQPARIVTLDATLFRHTFDDLRSLDAPPVGVFPAVIANSLEGSSHGVELGVNLQPVGWWHTHVSYTWLDSDVSRVRGIPTSLVFFNEANDPSHLFGLRSSFDLPRDFELDAMLRSVGALPDPAVPAYTELNVRLGWRLTPRANLWIVGEDLLHDSHPEFGSPGPTRVEFERGIRIGATVRF